MFKKIMTLLATIALVISTATAQADVKAPLKGMFTSVSAAKNMASTQYYDGTNVLLVNWSHQPVIVKVPALNVTITLNALGSGNNTYYIYSPSYYPYVYADIYDYYSYTPYLLESYYAENPSTVEIRDEDLYYAQSAAQHGKAHLKITKHAGV